MSTTDVVFVLVCGIGTLNSVLLATHLLRSGKGERRLNQLLAALLLLFSLRIAKAVALLFVAGFHPLFELLWIVALGATGLPALLYAAHLTSRTARLGRCTLAAAGGALLWIVPILLFLPLGGGWRWMGAALGAYAGGVGAACGLVVGWWPEAGADRTRRRWAASLLSFLVGVWLLHAGLIAARLLGPVNEDRFFKIEAVLFSLAVYLLVYLEMRGGLFGRLHQAGARDRVAPDDPMLQRVRRAVENDRLFLDPSLSLPSLARSLNLSPQHVSRLINSGIGSSFNDYVNRLRIDEACRVLAGPDGASRKIGALAFDCGFGSASVFYAAFRKQTGRTPTEYQKSLSALHS